MPHLTPQRAYLYDQWIVPWAVRIGGVWILFDAYAPQLPPGGVSVRWLLDWGEVAIIQAIAILGYVFRGEWEALEPAGWVAFVLLLIAAAVIKRISPLYNWPAHRFLSKKTIVTVTPAMIAFKGGRYDGEGVGQVAVFQHQDLGMETMRDQSRQEAGKRPRGKARYFQNAFEVVMPYHGQPVVIASIYGNKLAADQVAARLMLARQLAAQAKTADADADEFGPSPSIPGGETS